MEKSSGESAEPLLQDFTLPPITHSRCEPTSNWLVKQWKWLVITLLTFYIAIIVTLNIFSSRAGKSEIPYSPANAAIQYEEHPLWDGKPTPWDQSPSDEVDAAWDDLLTAKNVRVTEAEMIKNHENFTNTVQLADGDYLAVLGVYHQLHCLNILRKGVYPDYYKPRMNDKDMQVNYNSDHFNHCIGRIRQSIMCHADLAFYSAEWVADSHEPVNKQLRSEGQLTCKNWDAVESWSRERALKLREFLLRAGPYEHHHNTKSERGVR